MNHLFRTPSFISQALQCTRTNGTFSFLGASAPTFLAVVCYERARNLLKRILEKEVSSTVEICPKSQSDCIQFKQQLLRALLTMSLNGQKFSVVGEQTA
jgi:hypothetical protein